MILVKIFDFMNIILGKIKDSEIMFGNGLDRK